MDASDDLISVKETSDKNTWEVRRVLKFKMQISKNYLLRLGDKATKTVEDFAARWGAHLLCLGKRNNLITTGRYLMEKNRTTFLVFWNPEEMARKLR